MRAIEPAAEEPTGCTTLAFFIRRPMGRIILSYLTFWRGVKQGSSRSPMEGDNLPFW